MKKLFLLGFMLFCSTSFLLAQTGIGPDNVVTNSSPNFSTGFGDNNTSDGQYSFAGGSFSSATGSHSFGFGQNVVSNSTGSFALGKFVEAIAENSWIIGTGFLKEAKWESYKSTNSNSLTIGFNMLERPSIFVSPFDIQGTGGGYVGIHNTSPTSELDVKGTITTNGLKLAPVLGGGITPGDVLTAIDNLGNVGWATPSGGGSGESLWGIVGSTNHINYLDGNVGIGNESFNPTAKLHVIGNILNDGDFVSTGTIEIDNVASEIRYGKYSVPATFKIQRQKSTVGGKSEAYYWKDVLVIDDNENIGIGTDTPSAMLDVSGDFRVQNDMVANEDITIDGELKFSEGLSQISFGSMNTQRSLKIISNSNPPGKEQVQGITISPLGELGIGTDIPNAKLDVRGTTITSGLQLTSDGSTPNYVLTDSDGFGNAVWTDIGTMSGVGVWDENGSGDVAHYIGAVGIGTSNVGTHKLVVNGSINATLIKVTETVPQSDYVFEADYDLMSLSDLEQYIKTHKHLPEVMSAEEFARDGYSLGEMDDILLRKVEELTLYVIDQDKTIKQQQELLDKQQQLIDQLLEAKK